MTKANPRSFLLALQIAVVVLVLAGFYLQPEPVEHGVSVADHRLTALLADIDTERLMQTVNVLANESSRRFTSKGATAAADYITEQLRAYGYGVEHQYINVEAPDGRSVVVTNVLCDLAADGHADVLLCAHYDSRGEHRADLAPGADDNASGVAVLLETARVLAKHNLQVNVRLAFFGGEEDAFIGSQGYIDDADFTVPAAVINVDMVGYDEYGPMDMVVFANPASLSILHTLEQAASRHTKIQLAARIENSGNSDHVTFWERGVPAVSLWEGFDHNPHYHTEHDIPEHLSPRFLSEVARLVVATAFQMGVPGGEAVGRVPSARLTWFGGVSSVLSERFIGEHLVDALPALESRLTVLTYKGRVLREWLLPAERVDPSYLLKQGETPGVYLLSRVVDDTHVPVRAIVVK